jgi:hypothetical protein
MKKFGEIYAQVERSSLTKRIMKPFDSLEVLVCITNKTEIFRSQKHLPTKLLIIVRCLTISTPRSVKSEHIKVSFILSYGYYK